MVLTFVPFVDKDKLTALDPEVDLIRRLVDMVAKGDSHADQTAAVNLYVTLKSKHLIILTGDSQSDNSILVRALARVLLGDNHLQSQALMGHQWWVGAHGASGTLTTIHARFVTEKILAAMDEASQPEHSDRIYIVCLSQISPAELSSCFVEVTYQLSHGEVMRIGDVHFSKPLRYPDNIWLISTIDESHVIPLDENLMSEAVIIQPQ